MILFADLLHSLPWIVIGVIAGVIVGAIPGLTGAMVIALAVPLTFAMEEGNALALLVSLYTGSVSGGLISATLLKIPGTPASMITILDAHPLAEAGQPGRALGLGIGASLFGGIFSGIALILLARPVAAWSVYLGPFDLLALVLLALAFIIAVAEPGRVGAAARALSGSWAARGPRQRFARVPDAARRRASARGARRHRSPCARRHRGEPAEPERRR